MGGLTMSEDGVRKTSRSSFALPRVALAAWRQSLRSRRLACLIDDNSDKTSVPWVAWPATVTPLTQFRHNCTGERLPLLRWILYVRSHNSRHRSATTPVNGYIARVPGVSSQTPGTTWVPDRSGNCNHHVELAVELLLLLVDSRWTSRRGWANVALDHGGWSPDPLMTDILASDQEKPTAANSSRSSK